MAYIPYALSREHKERKMKKFNDYLREQMQNPEKRIR